MKRRLFLIVGIIALGGAASFPLVSASCNTQQSSRAAEPAVIERLRAMTRGGVMPAETVVAGIASEYEGTRAGALARVLQARARLAANDPASAGSLLADKSINRQTAIGDHALWLRAQALEQLGQSIQARAAYEQLARDFPSSLRAREATVRAGTIMFKDGQAAAAVPALLKTLTDADDAAALLLAARAYEMTGDPLRALAAYRRLYFYAPASPESAEAASALARLNSTSAPASPEEALARAERLAANRRYSEATDAYADAFARYSNAATAQAQLRRGIAAFNARRTADAIAALNAVPTSAVDERAEALFYLTQVYARAGQWSQARATTDEMRRIFPNSPFTVRAFAAAGTIARDAKNTVEASNFFRTGINAYPGAAELASAQFEIAWTAHTAKNYAESSRLLIEHLASYADKNTDNRGRAGYWAARDSERAGRLAEARAIYEAMQERYGANWYGQLSRQRLTAMGNTAQQNFSPDSPVARATANLRPVSVARETAGPSEEERIRKADDLVVVGLDDWAHAELDKALETTPDSPRVNLAKARIYRSVNENVQAFNVLRRSYPDYGQMTPEELTPEEWDVFYPLAYWDIIVQEARAKRLDPFTVAGLIRQESVFNPRAVSSARAYGLMQLLLPTARMTANRYGVDRAISVESLFEPRLNIQLGTGYMREQMDKYGRIEYMAAAYNAGPGRATAWIASLPSEMDEWAEAIPFRETRGYVQGVVRNTLQYRRLYDEQGRFRPEVGSRAARPVVNANATTPPQPGNTSRPRRVTEPDDKQEQ